MRWFHISREIFRQKNLRFMAHCHLAWSRNLVPLLLLILLQWPFLIFSIYQRYLFFDRNLILYAFDSFLVIAGCAYFIAVLDSVPGKNVRHNLLVFFLALVASISSLECFVLLQHGMLLGEGILVAVAETNLSEAAEYLYSARHTAWIVLLLSLLFAVAVHCLQNLWMRHGKRLPRKILFLALPEIIFVFLSIIFFRYIASDIPFDLPLTRLVSVFVQTRKDMAEFTKLQQDLSKEVSILQDESTIPSVVLILGESTQRNRMHLYGYSLPNTPRLDALAGKGELAVYRDVISPESYTVASLRRILTFYDRESDKEWYRYSNLMDILRKAGYRTWWLSNQDSFGVWANTGTLFSSRADCAIFTQHSGSRDGSCLYDEALFPLLDDALAQCSGKDFLVLHLLGCHALYKSRFPAGFRQFTAQDIKEGIPSERKEDMADYANAVSYNDFIVTGILERFRERDAVVIYISDHGENIYDEGSDLFSHTHGTLNRYLYEIPMLVWASESFRQNHPEKWAAIQGSVSRPFMTDDLIHALLGLMDIRTMEYDPRKDLFSPEFDAGRRRLVSGKDYDRDLRCSRIEE